MGPTYRNSDVYADFLEHYVGYGPRVERWKDCPRSTQKAIYIWINGHRYYYSYGVKRLQPADNERKLYISTAGCRLHTVFEDFIKEKEKEMSNNIKWGLKNITVENRSREETILNAEIEGIALRTSIADIMNISNEICNRLNVPEQSEEDYLRYCATDAAITQALYYRRGLTASTKLPKIKKVIFNNPATIVFWADETKTIVKCQENDIYDPEKGLAMAIAKKALGNEGNYFETIKKWVGEYEERNPVAVWARSFADGVKSAVEKINRLSEALHNRNVEKADKELKDIVKERLTSTLKNKKATKAELRAAMEDAINYMTIDKGSDA